LATSDRLGRSGRAPVLSILKIQNNRAKEKLKTKNNMIGLTNFRLVLAEQNFM
jgi:hypothetical protein